ncbi:MAG TPA: prepilin-type N-terminal cleavage/methylation domain-containing protein [Candidatus Sulfotelmatobacter sp.]|jgi:prepilin-type N-terminal cleavage/methylation domain-containing protein|nr:prepilin-type N-terminal cleavage/methylation domain-containing protein [Candidatus Sulfotelmatobacter sp.]
MKTAHKQYLSSKEKGFTLIELLVVITIIAALAITVFVALNPAGRLSNARDARRTADVDTMLTAIHASIVDNKGTAPAGLSTVEQQLGTATTGCAIATGGCTVTAVACLDLTTPLVKYLKSIPLDPKTGTAGITGYDAVQDSNGIVTIRACGTEGTNNISSSR